MTLSLERCGKCFEKYLTDDPNTYCISCRMDVKSKAERLKFTKHYGSGTNGHRTLKKHSDSLKPIEIDIMRRKGVDIP